MKKIHFFMVAGLMAILGSVHGQYSDLQTASATLSPSKSKLAWDNYRIDVGTVALNVPVEVDFTFVNKGNEPVVIKNVTPTCGCTAAKHSQAPVLPGESSKITVTYNAKKPGVFRKSIKIETSDDDNPTVLLIAGEVQ